MTPDPAATGPHGPAHHPTPALKGPQNGSQGALNGSARSRPRPGLEAVPPPPKTAWNAQELMHMDFPEPRWAVPGIICEGLSLLVSPPKVGKSWMALGLGLDIAAGRPAFGSIPVVSGPVLYLALEDTPRRLQARMRQLLASSGGVAPVGLTLGISCPPIPAGGDAYLVDWLDAHTDARLIVIDVLVKVRGNAPAGMTEYAADYAAITRIKNIADHYGVAIVVIHHVRKAGSEDFLQTVSGTNGLAGAADAVLVIERARSTADGVLHVTGRDVDENSYPLAFNPAAGAWRLLEGNAEDYQLRDTRALILRFVRDYPGQKPKQIADALNLNPDTVRQACRRMAEDRQLHVAPNGTYSRPETADHSTWSDTGDSGDTTSLSLLSPVSLRHSTASDLRRSGGDMPDLA